MSVVETVRPKGTVRIEKVKTVQEIEENSTMPMYMDTEMKMRRMTERSMFPRSATLAALMQTASTFSTQ